MKSSLCDSAQNIPHVVIGFKKKRIKLCLCYTGERMNMLRSLKHHPFERCHLLFYFIPQFAQ